jgi:hypothetical protein
VQVDSESESESSSDSESDAENVQLNDFELIPAAFDGAEAAGGYKRSVPERFSKSNDDLLMRSLYENYALEQKDANGNPSGRFYLDRPAAKAASVEVAQTHMFGGNKDKAYEFVAAKFEDVFGHFDVNKDNLIEIERMPQFLRYLLGNSLEIGLQ